MGRGCTLSDHNSQMPVALELLAPARTSAIGIAAIDCGADAVYIAGPEFGARAAAGNSVEEIAGLCRYAHIYDASIYAVVNTLVKDSERKAAVEMMWQLHDAGIDAFIVQDLSLLEENLPPVRLFASTQTVVRTPERARFLSGLGFERIIVERQLSASQIKAIADAAGCDIEAFVHGALCTGYSGECYLSQYLAGRSANRGRCAQACRSRYDVVDADGRVLLRDRPILSMKDLRLDSRIEQLVGSGVTSFKIEGRLKNASYVKNIVRHYSDTLNAFIGSHEGYCRASSGRPEGGFRPDPDLTFNRGYTEAFIDGQRGKWNSLDAARSLGEPAGTVKEVRGNVITIDGGKCLSNGDGLAFVSRSDEVSGMRAETAEGARITVKDASGISQGMKVYRTFNIAFERELEKNMPRRVIDASVCCRSENGVTAFRAEAAGRSAVVEFDDTAPEAGNRERALDTIRNQMGKSAGPYLFRFTGIETDTVRFYQASFLNSIRRSLAEKLQEAVPVSAAPAAKTPVRQCGAGSGNISVLEVPEQLMRSKYCVKWEMGICPKLRLGKPVREPLFIVNQNHKLRLHFDCKNCEMVVTL